MAWGKEKFANEEALKTAIKQNSKNIFIFFGDDGYLKKMYCDKISKSIADSDDIFNFHKFTAECDLQDVYDAVLQFPMMSDKKCVILDDYDFEHAKKEDFEKLCSILEENPETCILILHFDGLDIEYKKNSRFEALSDFAQKNNGITVELSHRSVPELVKMLSDGARKRGCSLDSNTARYLIEICGQDINILVNELEKLCYFVDKGEITKQTVENIATKTIEAKIYDLSNQIVNCNIDLCLKTIDELFFMRVEPIIILSTVSAFYVDLYRLYTGSKKSISINEIAEKFSYGSKKFTLEKAQPHLKKFDAKKFNLSFKALYDADKSLKSFSLNSRTVLEQLAVKLCYIITKGEGLD